MSTARTNKKLSATCLELLNLEIINSYLDQELVSPQSAIQAIGYRVGRQLAEKYSQSKPVLDKDVDIIKFLCTEFWREVFGKKADKLMTDNKGTYVLLDQSFRWLSNFPASSTDALYTKQRAMDVANLHVALPCAVIESAMGHLGLQCTVSAQVEEPPACKFRLSMLGSGHVPGYQQPPS